MPPEGFAVLSSLFFAGNQVAIKVAMRDATALSGECVSLAAASAVSVAALLLTDPAPFDPHALVFLAVGGQLGSAMVSTLTIIAVDRLGPATSVPLQRVRFLC
jgi:drug/metabolite transporter (DMT)-like permease